MKRSETLNICKNIKPQKKKGKHQRTAVFKKIW